MVLHLISICFLLISMSVFRSGADGEFQLELRASMMECKLALLPVEFSSNNMNAGVI